MEFKLTRKEAKKFCLENNMELPKKGYVSLLSIARYKVKLGILSPELTNHGKNIFTLEYK